MEAHSGINGTLLWQLDSDYTLPPSIRLDPPVPDRPDAGPVGRNGRAGGTVIVRSQAGPAGRSLLLDSRSTAINNYNANPDAYNSSVQIITPITTDSSGNLYFGYLATNAPGGLQSGLARIDMKAERDVDQRGRRRPATGRCRRSPITAPRLSAATARRSTSPSTMSMASPDGAAGYLVALDSTTLAPSGGSPSQGCGQAAE